MSYSVIVTTILILYVYNKELQDLTGFVVGLGTWVMAPVAIAFNYRNLRLFLKPRRLSQRGPSSECSSGRPGATDTRATPDTRSRAAQREGVSSSSSLRTMSQRYTRLLDTKRLLYALFKPSDYAAIILSSVERMSEEDLALLRTGRTPEQLYILAMRESSGVNKLPIKKMDGMI